jgi:alpha-D-xyloside xylohydrolase
MRALVMDFGYDKNVLEIDNQFMFGPSLLINPVTEYKARTRSVYLPEGKGWYKLTDGSYFKGGQTIVADASYTEIPIFVKAGSIIPFGPEIQYASEKSADPIRLYVYTGSDASFTLYEDEDINYNYEKGMFSTITFNYKEQNKTLTIEDRIGEFDGMLKDRTIEIVWIGRDKPFGLDLTAPSDAVIKYNGTKQTIKF